jgi:hypothetical protein
VRQGIRETRIELLLALAYVVVRVAAFVGIATTRAPDTISYLEVARLDPFSQGMLAGPRAPLVPLLYKLLGSDGLRAVMQLALSVACWVALAAALALWIERRGVRAVAFGAVLLFSLAPQITHWDSILLAESLSVSLTAALAAASLWLLRAPSWPRLAALVGIALLWVFTRDSNAYLVALAGVGMLVATPFVTVRRLTAAGGVALIVVALLSIVSANGGATADGRAAALAGQPDGSFGRTAEAYRIPSQQYFLFSEGRWEFPLLNVIGQRVLTDPGRLGWFQDHGMPVTPALRQMAGEYAPGRGGAFYRSPALAGFRQWLVQDGTSTYTQYLLTHPAYDLKAFSDDPRSMLFASETLPEDETGGAARESVRDVVPEPLRRAFLARSAPSYLLWFALFVAAAFLALTRVARRSWFVPLALLASTIPHMFVIWHGDSQELQRHALLIGVMGRLGVLLLLFLALGSPRRERVWPLRARREGDRDEDTSPAEQREPVATAS